MEASSHRLQKDVPWHAQELNKPKHALEQCQLWKESFYKTGKKKKLFLGSQ